MRYTVYRLIVPIKSQGEDYARVCVPKYLFIMQDSINLVIKIQYPNLSIFPESRYSSWTVKNNKSFNVHDTNIYIRTSSFICVTCTHKYMASYIRSISSQCTYSANKQRSSNYALLCNTTLSVCSHCWKHTYLCGIKLGRKTAIFTDSCWRDT